MHKLLAPLARSVLGQRRFQVVFVAQSLVELADQILMVAIAWAGTVADPGSPGQQSRNSGLWLSSWPRTEVNAR